MPLWHLDAEDPYRRRGTSVRSVAFAPQPAHLRLVYRVNPRWPLAFLPKDAMT